MNGLNLTELLRKTAKCLNETRFVFKWKYSVPKFLVFGPLEAENDEIVENGGIVYLTKFNVIFDIFKYFGDLIQTFEINFEQINSSKAKEIVKFLDNRSSASLYRLNLHNYKGNLNEFKNTFVNVYRMNFSTSESFEFNNMEKKLNNLVPNLEYLFLDYKTDFIWNVIDGSFSELNEFGIEFPKSTERFDESKISSFFQNNSQIEELRIVNANAKVLRVASEHLPKLKTLNIDGLADHYLNFQNRIQFNNVKRLCITDREDKVPGNIIFDQIEDFFLDIQPTFSEKWIRFLTNQINSNLKKIKIFTSCLKNEDFLAITNIFRRIEIVSVRSDSPIKPKDVLKFLRMGKKLTNLNLIMKMNENDQKKLKDTLPIGTIVEFIPHYSGNLFIIIKR